MSEEFKKLIKEIFSDYIKFLSTYEIVDEKNYSRLC